MDAACHYQAGLGGKSWAGRAVPGGPGSKKGPQALVFGVERRPLLGLLALDGAPTDVLAILHAVKPDSGQDFVCALLGRFEILAERGHTQHAAARSHRPALAIERGAGMEHMPVSHRARQACDKVALLRRFRVIRCSHHDPKRDATISLSDDLIELAVDACLQ